MNNIQLGKLRQVILQENLRTTKIAEIKIVSRAIEISFVDDTIFNQALHRILKIVDDRDLLAFVFIENNQVKVRIHN